MIRTLPAAVAFTAGVALAHASFGGERVYDVPAGHNPGVWAKWEIEERFDLSVADGIEFDFLCDDMTRFSDFFLWLRTGYGSQPWEFFGYMIRFQPEEFGRWHRIRLRKLEAEGLVRRARPGGDSWSDIKSITLVGQQGEGRGKARVGIRNLRPIRPDRMDAVVVLGEHGIPRDGGGQLKTWYVGMVKRHQDALDILGVGNVAMADTDIAARGVPDGVKLVSCPMNQEVPDGMCEALSEFMARGGKVLWSHGMPPKARECLRRHPESSTNVVNKLDKSDNHHVFAYANRLRPVVEGLVPGLAKQIARSVASRKEAEKRIAAEIRAIPPVAGEERILDCHDPYGPWPDDGGLARAARFAKECGFTALDLNVCQGPTAWYESKVLRRNGDVSVRGDAVRQLVESCRVNGLKSVAWRCCFVVNDRKFPEVAEECSRAGRCTVGKDMKPNRSFLCPVNPLNRKEDVDAFAELAGMGVDVVEMDFIRYLGADHCCCTACREAFEAKIGERVANWPDDVFKDEKKGGHQQKWRNFRAEAITSHIREIRAAVKAVNPKVELWSSCFPHAGSAFANEAQDWTAWCREGIVDRLGMMDYSLTSAGFEGLIAAQRTNDFGSFTNFAPVFGDVRWHGATTIAEKALVAAKQIEAVRRQGYRTFSYFCLSPDTVPILKLLSQGPLGNVKSSAK